MRILKIIGLLLEYPDSLLWDNREEALELVVPMRRRCCRLLHRCWPPRCSTARPNGAKCLTADGPPRCCCLNMFTPNPATAARQWSSS